MSDLSEKEALTLYASELTRDVMLAASLAILGVINALDKKGTISREEVTTELLAIHALTPALAPNEHTKAGVLAALIGMLQAPRI